MKGMWCKLNDEERGNLLPEETRARLQTIIDSWNKQTLETWCIASSRNDSVIDPNFYDLKKENEK